jgi:Dyp-type peroxidase family
MNLEDIQGLILRGYGHLRAARFFLFRVTDAKRAAPWLAALPLTDARRAADKADAPGPFVNVAFTHPGLQALGVDPALLDSFPRDYVEGPDTPERARILADHGASASSEWAWGSVARPVHVALLVYSETDATLEPVAAEHLRLALAAGLELAHTLETRHLPDRKEHFGFRDGIAQPVVRGSRPDAPGENVIPEGEMLLGRENAFGEVTHAPVAPDGFPFGLDGSYLVVRQLEQDVRGFWRQAVASGLDPLVLAAKMVGRWPSGAPLVLHPSADPHPPGQVSNEDRFTYAVPDPDGKACPFGAHVRRSNPRDWGVAPTPSEAVTVTRRHRIVRRGRAYGKESTPDMSPASLVAAAGGEGDGVERGLQFLAFNANIERQFEFVQQQWLGNPKFGGLTSEADPVLGAFPEPTEGVDPPTFSVPEGSGLSRRVTGLASFVRVRGSGYFFMPSIPAVRYLAGRIG